MRIIWFASSVCATPAGRNSWSSLFCVIISGATMPDVLSAPVNGWQSNGVDCSTVSMSSL